MFKNYLICLIESMNATADHHVTDSSTENFNLNKQSESKVSSEPPSRDTCFDFQQVEIGRSRITKTINDQNNDLVPDKLISEFDRKASRERTSLKNRMKLLSQQQYVEESNLSVGDSIKQAIKTQDENADTKETLAPVVNDECEIVASTDMEAKKNFEIMAEALTPALNSSGCLIDEHNTSKHYSFEICTYSDEKDDPQNKDTKHDRDNVVNASGASKAAEDRDSVDSSRKKSDFNLLAFWKSQDVATTNIPKRGDSLGKTSASDTQSLLEEKKHLKKRFSLPIFSAIEKNDNIKSKAEGESSYVKSDVCSIDKKEGIIGAHAASTAILEDKCTMSKDGNLIEESSQILEKKEISENSNVAIPSLQDEASGTNNEQVVLPLAPSAEVLDLSNDASSILFSVKGKDSNETDIDKKEPNSSMNGNLNKSSLNLNREQMPLEPNTTPKINSENIEEKSVDMLYCGDNFCKSNSPTEKSLSTIATVTELAEIQFSNLELDAPGKVCHHNSTNITSTKTNGYNIEQASQSFDIKNVQEYVKPESAIIDQAVEKKSPPQGINESSKQMKIDNDEITANKSIRISENSKDPICANKIADIPMKDSESDNPQEHYCSAFGKRIFDEGKEVTSNTKSTTKKLNNSNLDFTFSELSPVSSNGSICGMSTANKFIESINRFFENENRVRDQTPEDRNSFYNEDFSIRSYSSVLKLKLSIGENFIPVDLPICSKDQNIIDIDLCCQELFTTVQLSLLDCENIFDEIENHRCSRRKIGDEIDKENLGESGTKAKKKRVNKLSNFSQIDFLNSSESPLKANKSKVVLDSISGGSKMAQEDQLLDRTARDVSANTNRLARFKNILSRFNGFGSKEAEASATDKNRKMSSSFHSRTEFSDQRIPSRKLNFSLFSPSISSGLYPTSTNESKICSKCKIHITKIIKDLQILLKKYRTRDYRAFFFIGNKKEHLVTKINESYVSFIAYKKDGLDYLFDSYFVLSFRIIGKFLERGYDADKNEKVKEIYIIDSVPVISNIFSLKGLDLTLIKSSSVYVNEYGKFYSIEKYKDLSKRFRSSSMPDPERLSNSIYRISGCPYKLNINRMPIHKIKSLFSSIGLEKIDFEKYRKSIIEEVLSLDASKNTTDKEMIELSADDEQGKLLSTDSIMKSNCSIASPIAHSSHLKANNNSDVKAAIPSEMNETDQICNKSDALSQNNIEEEPLIAKQVLTNHQSSLSKEDSVSKVPHELAAMHDNSKTKENTSYNKNTPNTSLSQVDLQQKVRDEVKDGSAIELNEETDNQVVKDMNVERTDSDITSSNKQDINKATIQISSSNIVEDSEFDKKSIEKETPGSNLHTNESGDEKGPETNLLSLKVESLETNKSNEKLTAIKKDVKCLSENNHANLDTEPNNLSRKQTRKILSFLGLDELSSKKEEENFVAELDCNEVSDANSCAVIDLKTEDISSKNHDLQLTSVQKSSGLSDTEKRSIHLPDRKSFANTDEVSSQPHRSESDLQVLGKVASPKHPENKAVMTIAAEPVVKGAQANIFIDGVISYRPLTNSEMIFGNFTTHHTPTNMLNSNTNGLEDLEVVDIGIDKIVCIEDSKPVPECNSLGRSNNKEDKEEMENLRFDIECYDSNEPVGNQLDKILTVNKSGRNQDCSQILHEITENIQSEISKTHEQDVIFKDKLDGTNKCHYSTQKSKDDMFVFNRIEKSISLTDVPGGDCMSIKDSRKCLSLGCLPTSIHKFSKAKEEKSPKSSLKPQPLEIETNFREFEQNVSISNSLVTSTPLKKESFSIAEGDIFAELLKTTSSIKEVKLNTDKTWPKYIKKKFRSTAVNNKTIVSLNSRCCNSKLKGLKSKSLNCLDILKTSNDVAGFRIGNNTFMVEKRSDVEGNISKCEQERKFSLCEESRKNCTDIVQEAASELKRINELDKEEKNDHSSISAVDLDVIDIYDNDKVAEVNLSDRTTKSSSIAQDNESCQNSKTSLEICNVLATSSYSSASTCSMRSIVDDFIFPIRNAYKGEYREDFIAVDNKLSDLNPISIGCLNNVNGIVTLDLNLSFPVAIKDPVTGENIHNSFSYDVMLGTAAVPTSPNQDKSHSYFNFSRSECNISREGEAVSDDEFKSVISDATDREIDIFENTFNDLRYPSYLSEHSNPCLSYNENDHASDMFFLRKAYSLPNLKSENTTIQRISDEFNKFDDLIFTINDILIFFNENRTFFNTIDNPCSEKIRPSRVELTIYDPEIFNRKNWAYPDRETDSSCSSIRDKEFIILFMIDKRFSTYYSLSTVFHMLLSINESLKMPETSHFSPNGTYLLLKDIKYIGFCSTGNSLFIAKDSNDILRYPSNNAIMLIEINIDMFFISEIPYYKNIKSFIEKTLLRRKPDIIITRTNNSDLGNVEIQTVHETEICTDTAEKSLQSEHIPEMAQSDQYLINLDTSKPDLMCSSAIGNLLDKDQCASDKQEPSESFVFALESSAPKNKKILRSSCSCQCKLCICCEKVEATEEFTVTENTKFTRFLICGGMCITFCFYILVKVADLHSLSSTYT